MNATVARLLVVEDCIDDERLIIRALKKLDENMEVHVLRDGEKAADYLCGKGSSVTRPDLVILDWKLPLLMGADVLRRVRGTESCKGLPVVIFSSSDCERDREECRALGGSAYVVKPVEYTKFLSAIQGIVREHCPRRPGGDAPSASMSREQEPTVASSPSNP
ncbi:MAG: hypothetical protein QOJ65_2522 [Fimbriimonadaceae bacterium]|jgi:DNA-binding response OmpR family regulator|nr:hypothetical protein [Fimbriimonadaceae bacterium]